MQQPVDLPVLRRLPGAAQRLASSASPGIRLSAVKSATALLRRPLLRRFTRRQDAFPVDPVSAAVTCGEALGEHQPGDLAAATRDPDASYPRPAPSSSQVACGPITGPLEA